MVVIIIMRSLILYGGAFALARSVLKTVFWRFGILRKEGCMECIPLGGQQRLHRSCYMSISMRMLAI